MAKVDISQNGRVDLTTHKAREKGYVPIRIDGATWFVEPKYANEEFRQRRIRELTESRRRAGMLWTPCGRR